MRTTKSYPVAPGQPVITRSRAVWREAMKFEAGSGQRTHAIDGNSDSAPSPVETLLSAVATCSGSDVVDFLEKRRTPLTSMEIDVVATRRTEQPRRVMKLEITFTLEGAAIEREQAERAIKLSFENYCTVAASLAGDIDVRSTLVLNGERSEPVQQAMFSATFPPR
ncbi:MAG: OsmC family protein [Gemmatimonadaceae bacterium]